MRCLDVSKMLAGLDSMNEGLQGLPKGSKKVLVPTGTPLATQDKSAVRSGSKFTPLTESQLIVGENTGDENDISKPQRRASVRVRQSVLKVKGLSARTDIENDCARTDSATNQRLSASDNAKSITRRKSYLKPMATPTWKSTPHTADMSGCALQTLSEGDESLGTGLRGDDWGVI
jgi:hypothetical protein